MEEVTLLHGDCLEVMKSIGNKSIDAIICDLPYGTTACKWDSIIPFEPLWEQYKRIIKDNGAIVLTSTQPFTSALVMSNPKWFKYQWIWDKKIPSGMSYARFQPMRQHEDVLVFCNGKTLYNAQITLRDKPIKKGGNKYSESAPIQASKLGKDFKKTYTTKQPTTIIVFDKVRKGSVHPTQKPIELMEYFVKTYTNEGDTVLDNCMGSGTTGLACKNLGRLFIGIEQDANYFEIAKTRIYG
tara:strand:- start:46 stop:768 length:723 start_codon:yes stop_codon:yes gene_type:complete